MDEVLKYSIPVLHPLAGHFPIALILVGFGTVMIWVVRDTVFWRGASLLLMGLGMAGGLFAYFTGEALEEHVEGTPIVEELVHLHEDMALYTLIATGIALLGLIGAILIRKGLGRTRVGRPGTPLWIRLVVGVAALAAAALIAWTAHIGGVMVWGVAA